MDPALLLVIWFVCAILAAAIAGSRGHNAGFWFVVGGLFGPFGVFGAILVSPQGKALEQQQLAVGQARTCPYCAETIKAEAVVCRFCGRDVEPVAAIYHGSRYARVGKCSQCGEPVRVDATGCGACGVLFAAPPEATR